MSNTDTARRDVPNAKGKADLRAIAANAMADMKAQALAARLAAAEAGATSEPAYVSATPATTKAKRQGYAKGVDAPKHYILVYVQDANPKAKGSKAWDMFEASRAFIGKTVAELDAGTTRGDTLWNLPRGYIRIEPPKA